MSGHKGSSGSETWVSGISLVSSSIIPAIQGSAGCDGGTSKHALETLNTWAIRDTQHIGA